MTSVGQPRPQGPVWRTRPIPATPSDTDGRSLSERDRARARRIAHPAARARFVVGRALLRDAVAELDMITRVSERLGVDVPEKDYPQLRTLDGAVRYLAGRTGALAG
jgi:hypothetical protein